MKYITISLYAIAFCVPFFDNPTRSSSTHSTPTWPTHFESHPLQQLPLSHNEKMFKRDFPGAIARFSDGRREIIMRYVTRASRRLHPAGDCLKGAGFSVNPLPIRVDLHQHLWGCVRAIRAGNTVRVCERIYDQSGNSWSDVSSWYWAALFGRTESPWIAITFAEDLSDNHADEV